MTTYTITLIAIGCAIYAAHRDALPPAEAEPLPYPLATHLNGAVPMW